VRFAGGWIVDVELDHGVRLTREGRGFTRWRQR
jgi:hypothetical protein